ncbi:hypothetical protein TKV_c18220 [Thermoanaerobacter kivui]|uniref:Uncharacterized protein n=1 Tax=Thermoanaerobacter kivui TaxID=2325 RepID=A0A097AT50_THEKI|nr:hypothetical protein [Thermoanaerobacter kivui]AIS52972.1 hypothetical protein TKV_c18220 [Thermoanaerobacter kivui]
MFNIKGVDEKRCIEIFLSTLPYEVLIKPFKRDTKLQKKLAGFRLIKSACPPKKIIPILREEIIKGNVDSKSFVEEWKKIYKDIINQIENLTFEELDKKVHELLNLYAPEVVFSGILLLNDEGTISIIDNVLEMIEKKCTNEQVPDILESSGGEETAEKLKKVNKKLLKEIKKITGKID